MTLVIDDERAVRAERCASCGAEYVCVTGFVLDGATPVAVYDAALHGHGDPHEALLDVTLAEVPDEKKPRVTFGCRLGDFGSHGGLGAELTDGGLDHEQSPTAYGVRLDASEALGDRRLEEFWAVVDHVIVADPDLAPYLTT